MPVHRAIADTLCRSSVLFSCNPLLLVFGAILRHSPLHFLSLWLQYGDHHCAPRNRLATTTALSQFRSSSPTQLTARTRASACLYSIPFPNNILSSGFWQWIKLNHRVIRGPNKRLKVRDLYSFPYLHCPILTIFMKFIYCIHV